MMKLLAFLWSGCWHDWEATGQRIDVYGWSRDIPERTRFRYQCRKCARIKDMRT